MFDNLIESKAKKQKRAGGTVMSAFIHAAVISAAVYATAHATDALDKPKAEKVEFVTVKKDEPPPPKETPKPPPPDVVMKAPPPKGFQVLTAPIKIPDVLPDIDLSKSVTKKRITGKGVAGGTAKGVVGGTPQPVNDNQTYFEFQVEKQVRRAAGQSASAVSRHAALVERRRRSARAVRRRHDGPRRHEPVQGAQVDARHVHERRESGRCRT